MSPVRHVLCTRRVHRQGTFIRASIGGRDVPTYVVSRHESNWGFIMQSCWAIYTSWPMPVKGNDAFFDDETRAGVTVEEQWMEVIGYNRGLPFDDGGKRVHAWHSTAHASCCCV